MPKSEKVRLAVAVSAGAVVALSAATIVLQNGSSLGSGERFDAVHAALREGLITGQKLTPAEQARFRVADKKD